MMAGMTRAAMLLLLCSIFGLQHAIANRVLQASSSASASPDTSGLDVDDYCPFNSADSEQSSGTTKLYVKKLYTCITPGTGEANKALVPDNSGAITLPGDTTILGTLTASNFPPPTPTATSSTQSITQASFSTPTHQLSFANLAPSCVDGDGTDHCDLKYGSQFTVVNGDNNAEPASFTMNFEFQEISGRVYFSWDEWMYLVHSTWPASTNGPSTYGVGQMIVGKIESDTFWPKRQTRCLAAFQDDSDSPNTSGPPALHVFSTYPDDYPAGALVTIETDGTVTLSFGTDSSNDISRLTLESCSWNIN